MNPDLRRIGQRLKDYLQRRGLTLTGVARMSTFSQQELDAIVDGGTYPISRLMLLLNLFDDLNPEWLLRGEGAMLRRGTQQPRREYREDIEATDVLRRYSALPPANPELRRQVLALEEEVTTLRRTTEELATRLARLESRKSA